MTHDPTEIGGIKIHWAANAFPMMDDDAHQILTDDIEKNDVQVTAKAFGTSKEDAQLIDGRNRIKAVVKLGRDPWDYIEIIHPDDLGDPVACVMSWNLHRRHLTESQRAVDAMSLFRPSNTPGRLLCVDGLGG